MKRDKQNITARLQALGSVFQQGLEGRLAAIEDDLRGLFCEGEINDSRRTSLHLALHNLAGSAGTFGYPALGQQARLAEELVDTLGNTADKNAVLTRLNLAVAGLRGAVTALSSAVVTPCASGLDNPSDPQDFDPRLLYIVDDDTPLIEHMAWQLRAFGYQVRAFGSLDELVPAVAEARPDVLVMGMSFPEGNLAGAECLRSLQDSLDRPCPAVMMSAGGTLEARLAAVRAGASAFFVKPVNLDCLVGRLDLLSGRENPDPYRILIVDDDPEIAAPYAAVLESAGARVCAVSDPHQILQAMGEFDPELVLMDMHMPGCNGIELATLLRHAAEYANLPVVFLSGETNLTHQIHAIHAGANDFLEKPVQPNRLIAVATQHARHYRALRAQRLRDPLTGTLLHSAFKQALTRALATGEPFTLALVGVDDLAGINHHHGDAAGDQALKNLAHLLCHPLPLLDITVGRYSGGILMLLLKDQSAAQSSRLLEDLAHRYAALEHSYPGGILRATLSIGLATVPPLQDASTLLHATVTALGAARKKGGLSTA
ncbi:MAG: response regulator [Pseudomonadota bacterium]